RQGELAPVRRRVVAIVSFHATATPVCTRVWGDLERFTVGIQLSKMAVTDWGIATHRRWEMRSLSLDLRERIVALVEAGEHSLRELAELFAVDLSTIARLLQRYRNTGSVAAKPHGGGMPPKLDARAVVRLLELV